MIGRNSNSFGRKGYRDVSGARRSGGRARPPTFADNAALPDQLRSARQRPKTRRLSMVQTQYGPPWPCPGAYLDLGSEQGRRVTRR
jgi:hypothetical protein